MFLANLYIVPVEDTLAHDEQVSLGISRTESLLTEGQEAGGSLQEYQSRYAIRHSASFLLEQHGTGREIVLGSRGAMKGIHRVLKKVSGLNENRNQIVLCGILGKLKECPPFKQNSTAALLNSQS